MSNLVCLVRCSQIHAKYLRSLQPALRRPLQTAVLDHKASLSESNLKPSQPPTHELTTGFNWLNVRQFDHLQAQRKVEPQGMAKRRNLHVWRTLILWAMPIGAVVLPLLASMVYIHWNWL